MRQDQIQQCLRGRATAIHSLVALHRRRLLPALFLAMDLEPYAPADTLEEASRVGATVFNVALDRLKQAPAGHLFFPWLRATAIQTISTQVPQAKAADVPFATPHALGAQAPLEKDADVAAVRRAVQALPLRHKLLLWLVTVERLGIAQAAMEVGIAPPFALASIEQSLAHVRATVRGADAPVAAEGGTGAGAAPAVDEASLATHRSIINALYGEMTHHERSSLELALMRDSRTQTLFEGSSEERELLASSLVTEGITTTSMLRHLRSWRNFGNRGIKPWVWVGVELTLAAVIVIGLLFLNAGVPPPTVEVEPEVGRVDFTSARGDADRESAFDKRMAADTIAADTDAAADGSDGDADAVEARFALKVNDQLHTAPDASVRCQINGNNPIAVGPDSRFTLLQPQREFPVRVRVVPVADADRLPGTNLMGGRGLAWINFMGLDVAFEVETAALAISGRSAEFLIQHVDLAAANAPTEAVPHLLLVVLRGSVSVVPRREDTSDVNARDYDVPDAQSLTAGSGVYIAADGARHPAQRFRPSGFPRADGPEAVSLAFVRRYFRGGDREQFKTRFHWLDSDRYALGLDAAPPVVFDHMERYRDALLRLDEPSRALDERENVIRRGLDAAQVRRLQAEREVDAAENALTVFAEVVAELRDVEADLAAQLDLIAAYRQDTSDGRRYDPTGTYRFIAQVRWDVVTAQLDEVRARRTERDALALWLRPQVPKLERAQQEVADKQVELEAIGRSIASIDRDLEASADLEQRIRDAEADLDARRKALETTIGEKDAADERVATAQAAVDAMTTRMTEARERTVELDTARTELERRQTVLDEANHLADRMAEEREDLELQAERVKAQLQESTPEDEKIRLEAELAQLRDQIARLDVAIDEHAEKLPDFKAAVEEAQREYDALDPDSAPDLEALALEQATLQKELDDAKAAVSAASRAITSLERQVRQREGRLSGLMDSLEERNQLIADRAAEVEAQTECATALEAARGRYDELFAQIDPTRQRVAALDEQLAAVPNLERAKTDLAADLDRLDRHKRRLDDAHEERQRLEERVAELRYETRPEAQLELSEALMLANLEYNQHSNGVADCLEGLFLIAAARRDTREQIAPTSMRLRSALLDKLISLASDYPDLTALAPADKHWILSEALRWDAEIVGRAGQSWNEIGAADVTRQYVDAVYGFFNARNEAGVYTRLGADDLAVLADTQPIADE